MDKYGYYKCKDVDLVSKKNCSASLKENQIKQTEEIIEVRTLVKTGN